MRVWEASGDQSGDGSGGSILGSILGRFWVDSRTISEKPHEIAQNCLHTAVGPHLKAKYD